MDTATTWRREMPRRRVIWAIGLPIALMVVASLMFVQNARQEKADLAAPQAAVTASVAPVVDVRPSIAVLPLVDMSGSSDQEYLADGISEELINALSPSPGLRVSGRTSAFSFKGKAQDTKQIGEQLGVDHLLEGSVRKAGDTLRITLQLINARDGIQTWSQTYDRKPTTIVEASDEIAAAVAAALNVKLPEKSGSAPRSRRAVDPDVFSDYLRARRLASNSAPAKAAEAVAAFEAITGRAPDFAAGHAHLASALARAAERGDSAEAVTRFRARALAAANRAIELDPRLAHAYGVRGNLRSVVSHEWAGARADFKKALSLDPGDSQLMLDYGSLLATHGQLSAAIELLRKASGIDPLDPSLWQSLGYYLEANGDLAQARSTQQKALALQPDYSAAHFRLGVLDLQERQPRRAAAAFQAIRDEALQWVGTALTEHELRDGAESQRVLGELIRVHGFNASYQIAQVHAWRRQPDEAFEWLERAIDRHDDSLAELKYDPLLRALHRDPRWSALLKRLDLPP